MRELIGLVLLALLVVAAGTFLALHLRRRRAERAFRRGHSDYSRINEGVPR